jgi:hypothetical protein
MTNLYVFWRLATDPPAPWTRLTRTNQYLRFNATPGNHWTQTGATAHAHPSVSGFTVGTSVHAGGADANTGSSLDDIQGPHSDHAAPGSYGITSNNNNPPGWGLDIIYMDLATWEAEVRSFPEGAVIISNGALVDAALERYSSADGKYIVNAEPETSVGTNTPQSHTVTGTLGITYGLSYLTCSMRVNKVGDRSLQHNHTISLASEAKYVEPRNLVTRLYRALQDTSKALAETVVFVDGAVGANWEILAGWAGGNLKGGDSDPTLSGSDTHTQTFSGNSSTYDGPDAFDNEYSPNRTVYDSHYHPVSGTLDSVSHVPSSRLIVPARLLSTVYHIRKTAGPQVIGLW